MHFYLVFPLFEGRVLHFDCVVVKINDHKNVSEIQIALFILCFFSKSSKVSLKINEVNA